MSSDDTNTLLIWGAGCIAFLFFFSLATALGVKYVTNQRLISDAAEALEHSAGARTQGVCISGKWGPYRAWGRYEPKMWQQIAMLYDIENSPLTLPRQKRPAQEAQERIASYFQHEGADYVSYVEGTFERETLGKIFEEKMQKAIHEADIDVGMVLEQMKPAADAMIKELEALLDPFHRIHEINQRAFIIYHMRTAGDRAERAD